MEKSGLEELRELYDEILSSFTYIRRENQYKYLVSKFGEYEKVRMMKGLDLYFRGKDKNGRSLNEIIPSAYSKFVNNVKKLLEMIKESGIEVENFEEMNGEKFFKLGEQLYSKPKELFEDEKGSVYSDADASEEDYVADASEEDYIADAGEEDYGYEEGYEEEEVEEALEETTKSEMKNTPKKAKKITIVVPPESIIEDIKVSVKKGWDGKIIQAYNDIFKEIANLQSLYFLKMQGKCVETKNIFKVY